jgi:EpsI family protein
MPLKRLFAVYTLLLVVVMACWPAMIVLDVLWTNTDARGNTHGYLVALISLLAIYYKRNELADAELRPTLRALPLILLSTFVWLVLWRAGLQDLHLLLIPVIAAAVIYVAFGAPILRILAFPLIFLLFALPFWEVLTAPLQWFTVKAQTAFIWLTHLPAVVDGNFVRLEAGSFEIEPGCSGLHFFVVGLAVAALYGEIAKDSLRARGLWLALMGVLAIASNWIRVFAIIIAGYFSDMQHYLVTVDHYRFGWILFAAVTLAFLFLTSRFPVKRKAVKRETDLDATVTALPRLVLTSQATAARAYLAATLSVLAIPSFAYAMDSSHDDASLAQSIDFPFARAPWSGPELAKNSTWRPYFEGASVSGSRAYRSEDGGTVELFGAVYRRQKQNAELVGFANSLFGGAGAPRVVNESVIGRGDSIWRETTLIDRNGKRSLVLWHYRIGERIFVQPFASQLYYGLSAITRPPVSALVALRTECVKNCDVARLRLESFATTNCSAPACGDIVNRGATSRRSQTNAPLANRGAQEAHSALPQVHAP